MIPRIPSDSAPVLLRPRGRRFCESCGEETTHHVTRKLTPVGKRLMVFAAIVTAVLYGHNVLRFESGGLGWGLLYWSLPAVVGAILLVLGLKRRGFDLRCERCNHTTFRLSPPRWTTDPPRDRNRA